MMCAVARCHVPLRLAVNTALPASVQFRLALWYDDELFAPRDLKTAVTWCGLVNNTARCNVAQHVATLLTTLQRTT